MSSSVRILLIDDSKDHIVTLTYILKECGYDNVTLCSAKDPVLSFVIEVNPHIILISVLSPTRDTLQQLTAIRDEHPTPVVLLSKDDRIHAIEEAHRCGVTSYLSRKLRSSQVKHIINNAILTFASFQNLKNELHDSKQKLAQQKLVDQAKRILMKEHEIDEEFAYHRIRRYAMDHKSSMGEVAKKIIDIKKV